jgi:DNA repair photolyase
MVWSITTCNEGIRRIIEPGTPPASAMFKVIKKFGDSGIRCAVNIDPIIPLVTDSTKDIEAILDNCLHAGVHNVFGATLRLRADIWERMKTISKLIDKENTMIKEYNRLFHFDEPFKEGYNLAVDRVCSNAIIQNLMGAVKGRGMTFGFPHLIANSSSSRRRYVESKKLHNGAKNQSTLMDFM